jgi:hypothetical protein
MAFLNVLGSNNPTIEVSFDYQNDPTSVTQTWTDITPYLVSYSRQPVRTNEFDQPGPAGATITLRNDDARFIPDNATGPYFGGLKKFRRCRVRAQWLGVTYNRYWGYINDWPQSWAQAGKDQTVTLQLTDALTPMQIYDLQGQSFLAKLSGAAIGDVLTAAGFPNAGGGAPVLDTGNSTIVASGVLATGSYAAQRLKDIAATENGVVYADGAGIVNFHDRHRRLVGGSSVNPQGTIGDAFTEIPYADDPQPQYGDVWPIVNVTPSGGAIQTVTVPAGTASYFNTTLNYPPSGTYLATSAVEALSAAQYVANRYSNPVTRIPDVTLIGAANPALWPTILALDTSSKVIFKRRFLSHGVQAGTIALTEFCEGYGDDVHVGKDWRVHVPLSPADIQSYWVLGDSVYGLLGQTTKLAY